MKSTTAVADYSFPVPAGVPVIVYHNDDARLSRIYEPGDHIERVHSFTVEEPTTVGDLLAGCWERYNIGECADAAAYRGVTIVDGIQQDDGSGKALLYDGQWYGIRSLSVGDVIVIGEVAYSVDSIGWRMVALAS